jgi:hypothetical protein
MTKLFLILVSAALLFSSCTVERKMPNMTLKGSIDLAKTEENGPSEISYNTKTGANVMVYDDYYFNEAEHDRQWNHSNSRETDDTVAMSRTPMPSFGIGGGLEFISKGNKFQEVDTKTSLNYLEVPIHLLYSYPLGDGNAYAGFGPYFAYAIGGQVKGGGFSQSSFGDDNGGYKRFDLGLQLMLGYKLNMGVSLDVSYDYGLTNIYTSAVDVTSKNRCFSINFGYQIGRLFQ